MHPKPCTQGVRRLEGWWSIIQEARHQRDGPLRRLGGSWLATSRALTGVPCRRISVHQQKTQLLGRTCVTDSKHLPVHVQFYGCYCILTPGAAA